MIVLSASGLTKMYGAEEIFSNVSFSINKGDRVGITGPNGAGKSTLLNVLSGETGSDEGSVFTAGGMKIGYFRQNALFSASGTVYEEMMAVFSDVTEMERSIGHMSEEISRISADPDHDPEKLDRLLNEYDRMQQEFLRRDGFSFRSEIQGVLNSMNFPESVYDKSVESLSGGERTRLALAVQLLSKPDILLLDEPTNHLDIETLRWLEQYLRGYQGTVLIISHDRYFLDHTVTRIFELNHHRLNIYEGNYSFYAEERKVRLASEMKAYEKQQAEIRRQEELISRYKQRGTEKLAKRAKSREKMLERTQRLEKPDGPDSRMRIKFEQDTASGNDTVQAVEISKTLGYGPAEKTIMQDVSFDIKRGERICIVGPNGAGKSTLLRMILSEIEPDSGYFRIGHNIAFGYYDQEQSMLDESGTVIGEMRDAYEQYGDTELRNLLGRFLFRGEDVFKPVSVLSGGERARLSLLKLMLSGANVLVLDEPTNHLDIDSKEVFEDALMDFPGTSVTVSHDRYLLNKVPTSIYELENGRLTEYKGRYDYYREKKEQLTETASNGASCREDSGAADFSESDKQQNIEHRRKTKEEQAEKRRKERRIAAVEERIAELEDEAAEIERELNSGMFASNHVNLAGLAEKLSEKKSELDELYMEWEDLSE